jgi:thiosulfate reductase cytochrome b subunit
MMTSKKWKELKWMIAIHLFFMFLFFAKVWIF